MSSGAVAHDPTRLARRPNWTGLFCCARIAPQGRRASLGRVSAVFAIVSLVQFSPDEVWSLESIPHPPEARTLVSVTRAHKSDQPRPRVWTFVCSCWRSGRRAPCLAAHSQRSPASRLPPPPVPAHAKCWGFPGILAPPANRCAPSTPSPRISSTCVSSAPLLICAYSGLLPCSRLASLPCAHSATTAPRRLPRAPPRTVCWSCRPSPYAVPRRAPVHSASGARPARSSAARRCRPRPAPYYRSNFL